ncbi:MAG TPA: DinB family protein [Candidatus Sulfotelmatobacter sp.]|nr:DinB family protein [Candidatus Sulfotelmatobacter sp.]
MNDTNPNLPEPWLRGTLAETPAVTRAVLHALQLAKEDLWKWCYGLSEEQLNERPQGIAPVAFHLLHISRSLDRLLTYAEGGVLDETQLALLKSELAPGAQHHQTFAELEQALQKSMDRVLALAPANLETTRRVGKKQLPTTLGGLLVHVADHTQRHVGQAILTAKLVARH